MERATVAGITAATVTLLACLAGLTACSDENDDNPCHGQPIVWVEQDDDETEYRCGSATGAVVPLVFIDVDTRDKAHKSPGKPVPFKPVPPAQRPKVDMNKPPAPAVKPPAPAPKVNPVKPAPAPPAGGRR